ncbi:MAG: signal peptidase I [Acidobacteriia bacterium]|nr:signal peptidase I [Terriglobia bacterium]
MTSIESSSAMPGSAGAVSVPDAATHTSGPPKGMFADVLQSLLVTLLLALFGTTFIVQAFKIPSQSMEPALLVGDHLLVNKFLFQGSGAWYEKFLPYRPVRHGDIVVFKFPFDDHPHYVKRVIGLPGDRIRITAGQVYVNENLLAEPYAVHDAAARDPFGDNFPPADPEFLGAALQPEWTTHIMNYVRGGELLVPPDRYFVMGDNRDRSWDSRYWGFVDRQAIIGRPVLIYWSVAATSADYADRSLFGTVRGIEAALLHLPASTRWNRMLREVH